MIYSVVTFGSLDMGAEFRHKKLWMVKSRYNLAYVKSDYVNSMHIIKDFEFVGVKTEAQ